MQFFRRNIRIRHVNKINIVKPVFGFFFFFFYFHLPMYDREIIFGGQIFEMEILIDLDILWSPKSENHILIDCSVCVSAYVYICVCLLSGKLQKKIQHKLQIWYSMFVSYVDVT